MILLCFRSTLMTGWPACAPHCALCVISGDAFTALFSDHDCFKVTGGLKVQLVCESTEHLRFLLTWLVVAMKWERLKLQEKVWKDMSFLSEAGSWLLLVMALLTLCCEKCSTMLPHTRIHSNTHNYRTSDFFMCYTFSSIKTYNFSVNNMTLSD